VSDPVLIRPIRASDAPLLALAHARLSPETVRRRYLGPKPRLSPRELRYLTDVDGVDHVALVAVGADDPRRLLAVARFVRWPEDPRAAEAAIVVADELQGQGLGRRMGLALADAARTRGIERFTATLLSDNAAAHALFATISDRLTSTRDSGIDELVAELSSAA
jgi:RimJ/RimL family protein N-acetyltransferase